jgi:hypothetical protein
MKSINSQMIRPTTYLARCFGAMREIVPLLQGALINLSGESVGSLIVMQCWSSRILLIIELRIALRRASIIASIILWRSPIVLMKDRSVG